MKEIEGRVFSIGKEYPPIPGCTLSKCIHEGENAIIHFSLAKHTDISAEIFPYYKLLLVVAGSLEVYGGFGESRLLREGDCILTPTDVPVGMRTEEGAVYTEIQIPKA